MKEVSGITGASLFSDFHGFAWLRAHDKPSVTMFSAKYHRLKGLEALQDNQLDRAMKSFTETIEACEKWNPDTDSDQIIESRFHRARAYWYRAESKDDLENVIKDSDKVIGYYEKGIGLGEASANELKRNLAKVYNTRALAYGHEKKAEFDKAIEDYTKAIALDEGFAKAYNNRGLAYISRD